MILKEKGIAYAFTCANKLSGKFSVNKKERIFNIHDATSTYMGESGDAKLFWNCLDGNSHYILSPGTLQLFYDGNKYLFFKRLTP